MTFFRCLKIRLIPLVAISIVVFVVVVDHCSYVTAVTGGSNIASTTGSTSVTARKSTMSISTTIPCTTSDGIAVGSDSETLAQKSPNGIDGIMDDDSNPNTRRLPKRKPQRPPFLKHVTNEQLRTAIQIATERHRVAVQRAESTYPVWQKKGVNDDNEEESKTNTASTHIDPSKAVPLKEFPLQLNIGGDDTSCLPDYEDLIPTTVYVTDPPILTREECHAVIQQAEQHFQRQQDSPTNGTWTRRTSGQYEICGFDMHEIPAVKEWFLRTARQQLIPLLQSTFPTFCRTDDNDNDILTDLCIDNAYLFKYTPETGRRTEIHTDSGCLSFTIALSSPDTDYDGGGTWFQGLHHVVSGNDSHGDDITSCDLAANDSSSSSSSSQNKNVLSMDVGQITIRPGGVKHCGYAVTRGTRYIIGGFCIHRNRPEYVRMLLQSSSSVSSPTETLQQRQELLEAATVLNPGCTAAYNLLANHHIQNGDQNMAQQILEYCLHHVDSLSSEVAYALGSIYMEQQMYEKALQYVSICLQVDPYDVEAIMMSATIASSLGDSSKERNYYHDIINIPDAKPSIKASAYCNLGVLHQGEEVELDYYRQSLICQPKTFSPTYSLASALASWKQYKESIALFRQAIVDLDDSSNTKNGRHDEMAENRRKALRSLYTATMQFIKEEQQNDNTTPAASTTTREEMIQKFQDIMGKENFVELQQQT